MAPALLDGDPWPLLPLSTLSHTVHVCNTSTHCSQFPQALDLMFSASFTPLLQTYFKTSPSSIVLLFFSQNKNIQPSTPQHPLPDPARLGYMSFPDLPFLPAWKDPRTTFSQPSGTPSAAPALWDPLRCQVPQCQPPCDSL